MSAHNYDEILYDEPLRAVIVGEACGGIAKEVIDMLHCTMLVMTASLSIPMELFQPHPTYVSTQQARLAFPNQICHSQPGLKYIYNLQLLPGSSAQHCLHSVKIVQVNAVQKYWIVDFGNDQNLRLQVGEVLSMEAKLIYSRLSKV